MVPGYNWVTTKKPLSRPRRSRMRYEKPEIVDYGSIADHTFTRCGGIGPKLGDFRSCELDNFQECSCSD